MKRTLIAIGIAIMVSMMIAPHKSAYRWPWDTCSESYAPFFMNNGFAFVNPRTIRHEHQDPEFVTIPGFWAWGNIGPVMIDKLALQTVFIATLFAVAVNIRRKGGEK